MAPRADDDTPRRGDQPRRGSSRDLPGEEHTDDPREGRRGRSSIGEARAYTPRGRTVAERGRLPRDGARGGDPFRPALQVLDGGESGQRTRGRGRQAEPPAPRERAKPQDQDKPQAQDMPRERAKSREKDRPRERANPREQDKPRERAKPREDKPRERARLREQDKPREKARDRERPRERELPRAWDRDARTRTPKEKAGPRRTATRKPVPSEPPKLANSTRRLRLGTVLALSLFVTIGVRLVVLQVATSPEEAASLLELREGRLSSVTLPAPRGSILDRDGHPLAHSVEARYVFADPQNELLQKNLPSIAEQLAPLVGIQKSLLMERMKPKFVLGKWTRFRYLARGVNIARADQVDALKLPGIYTHFDERRDVPGGDLAANLVGFTGDEQRGLVGLEARYDELLHGIDGRRVFEVGTSGMDAPIPGGYQHETAAQPGDSLKLTINQDLQFQVQRILNEAGRSRNATVGAAVVLDVKTGEVLSQASYPTYNAADPEKSQPRDRIDVASSVVTDPGSTHKAFIFGAALQEGLVKPTDTVTVGPAIKKGDTTFKDHHQFESGTKVTLPGLLAYSSNVGTILLADRLGKEKVHAYQQKFGLGKATGEGMPGEAEGKLLAPGDWSGSSYGSVPIGHSVDATLVQMAAAYAAIANDGVYIQPHLIKSTISGEDEKETPAAAPETHRVLDAEVARELRLMMEAVVSVKDGTGRAARVEGYRVAGKTGTGKMLIDGEYTSHNASSFIGMAPAENPRFVIAVSMDVSSGGGGDVAAPAFSQMMFHALAGDGVPPSGSKSPNFTIKE